MKDRILVISLSVIAVLALGVIVMFAFGTPQTPTSPGDFARAEESLPPMGETGEGTEPEVSEVATGEIPPPDPSSPLAIQIPGCVCHSDDPVLVEEHANYRMNQCFGCHSGGMPEMGQ